MRKTTKSPGEKIVKDIANQFGTSPELAEYRIKRLGLWRAYQNRSIDLRG
ncbi:hypothetical protein TRL7639_00042 [Falsiruegeria litorea R37]|uniref:Uncharacterized protein n=1 Tax=Falsiruegeria litorea R37 TaxID=1200284 RepID=A0A1Y5R7G1_9RHOB|nr:hypothetical protein TRL7639_00042 [Falsiruegeria litorea R37]